MVDVTIKKPTGNPLVAKKVWYFIQSVDVPIGSPALLPAFQTEGGVTFGGENIDEQTQKGIEIYSKDYFKDIIKYGYVDFQGKYDNYQVGHIEKNIYSLCRVKIIKGRKIQKKIHTWLIKCESRNI